MGIADRIGSLLPGKEADLIAVDLHRLGCQPVYDPHSALIYTSGAHQVTHAWIEGKLQLEDGRLLSLDEPALLEAAQVWRDRIFTAGTGNGK